MGNEHRALFSESSVYEGLSTNDPVTKLWNNSWAEVDRNLREMKREDAIQKELERQRQLKNQ